MRHLGQARPEGRRLLLVCSYRSTSVEHEAPLLFPDITYGFYPVYCRLYGIRYEEVPLDAAGRPLPKTRGARSKKAEQ